PPCPRSLPSNPRRRPLPSRRPNRLPAAPKSSGSIASARSNAMANARSPHTRSESDAFGSLDIAADKLWGAQTERSLRNFRIGTERMPSAIVHALGLIKRAAAEVNRDLGSLDRRRAGAIVAAAQDVAD